MTDNFSYLLPFIFFAFGCVFVVASTFGSPSSRFWGFGYILAALAFAAPILLGQLNPAVSAMVAEISFLSAFFFYGQALVSRFGVAKALAIRLSLYLTVLVSLAYVIFVQVDLRSEMLISDTTCALLLASGIVLVRRSLRTVVDKILVAMATLVVLDCASRALGTLILATSGSYPTMDSFFASDYAFFTQLSASVIGFLMALTVLGVIMSDIVASHRFIAEHDPLTDLLNRRGFEAALPVGSKGGVPAGAVIMGDIDHFKVVNDRYGHAVGDQVILAFAKALRESLPPEAAIARFGGEEFVVFLPQAGMPEAVTFAETVRTAFKTCNGRSDGVGQSITASFGVSQTAAGDHSVHEAIARADASLYQAKGGGRDRVVAEGQRLDASASALKIVASN
jgi:diguanylate cyclase (GGDEF)-like protein